MEYCQWVKGTTKRTLIYYNTAWKAWGSLLEAPITPQQINNIIIAMRKSGRLSDVTINTYLRGLRAFTRWLAEQKIQELVPVKEMRCEKPVPKIFHGEELQQLFAFVPKTRTQKRVVLMSKVIADCGLRSEECLSLRMDDINLKDLEILVRKAKFRKERIVPITVALRQELEPLVAARKPEDPLLITSTGTALIYRNAARDLVNLCKRLNITRPKTAWHTLRYTFATNYIAAGGNVVHLQRILGHATLQMTMRYVHLQTKDLAEPHARLSSLSLYGKTLRSTVGCP
jgi:integrase/recombinase XerD